MKENTLSHLKNLTLLLVEDDESLQEDLKTILSSFFKEVICASNGSEALKVFKERPIDMLIVDYVMPIMSGYELCLEIRKKNQKVPILIISNYSDKEKLLNSIPLNVTRYLVKPLNYTILTNALVEMLDRMDSSNLYNEFISSNINYDTMRKKLIINDKVVNLSKNEISTFELLLKHKNSIVKNETIANLLIADENSYERAIKNIIYRLRKKLGKETIVNIQSLGYILKIDE